MLNIDSLHFSYANQVILQDLSFQVKKQEIVALIGVSGSGKTTLFRLITGLLNSCKGHIKIDGQSLPQAALKTTYMRQEDLLLPWRTVLENLLLFMELGKSPLKYKDVCIQKARDLLKYVGLEGTESTYPYELSGGMRQRVSLARAFLQNRPLMLLDEPFASLDVIVREALYTLVRKMRSEHQKTIVIVTHDFRDAIALADQIFVLGEGKIANCYSVSEELRNDPQTSHQLIQSIRQHLIADSK